MFVYCVKLLPTHLVTWQYLPYPTCNVAGNISNDTTCLIRAIIRAAIFAEMWEGRKNPLKCAIIRTTMYTMVIWQLVLIGRASLMSG